MSLDKGGNLLNCALDIVVQLRDDANIRGEDLPKRVAKLAGIQEESRLTSKGRGSDVIYLKQSLQYLMRLRGLSFNRIAELTGCTHGTVMNNVERVDAYMDAYGKSKLLSQQRGYFELHINPSLESSSDVVLVDNFHPLWKEAAKKLMQGQLIELMGKYADRIKNWARITLELKYDDELGLNHVLITPGTSLNLWPTKQVYRS